LWGKSSRKRKRKSGRKHTGQGKRAVASKVPPELAGVLGEANMLYASHQYDEAIALLKDFIKKAPTIPDPFHTLGMIYEDRQDRAKALQFFLIACTLTPQVSIDFYTSCSSSSNSTLLEVSYSSLLSGLIVCMNRMLNYGNVLEELQKKSKILIKLYFALKGKTVS
jgi:tetratricopeptide (TPR) repeat protein